MTKTHLPVRLFLFLLNTTLFNEAFIGNLSGIDFGREWRLYDVGGSRTAVIIVFLSDRIIAFWTYLLMQRNAWLPYFDNVQAIIFRKLSSREAPSTYLISYPIS